MQKPPTVVRILLTLGILALSACGGAASTPTEAPPPAVPSAPTENVPTEIVPTEVSPTEVAPTENVPTVSPPTEAAATPVTRSDFVQGGLMYDNWMKATGADVPAGDHPLWASQTTNTRTGEDTWRCKECHGWDYKGAEGAYGSGSHQTGFPGVLGAASQSEEDLLAQLSGTKDPNHDFSLYLEEDQLNLLVAFLKEGMTDTASYINADKSVNGGDATHGQELFSGVCQECHGEDGKTFNFGDESAPEYLGTIAADNPWEFWHKVSFGQPGVANMPSALESGWSPQDIADLLAFVQTLPAE